MELALSLIIVQILLPSVIGGFVRGLVGIQKNVIAKKQEFEFPKLLFTLFVSMVVGGVAGILVGGNLVVSLLAGYAGSDMIEGLYKSRLLGIFKQF